MSKFRTRDYTSCKLSLPRGSHGSVRRGALLIAVAFILPCRASPQAVRSNDSSQIIELSLASRIFGNTRSIRVYLPQGYSPGDSGRRYPAFYFNDGFAVFSARSWNAARTLDSLIRARLIPPLIVVGIDNAASISGFANPARARANEFLS